MIFPRLFRRRIEDRSYTQLLTSARAAAVAGTAADVTQTAPAQYVAQMVAGMIATAEVEGPADVAGAVDARMLAKVASDLMLFGESCWDMVVAPGVAFRRCVIEDVRGGADPETWWYVLQLNGPSTTTTIRRPYPAILHFRIN